MKVLAAYTGANLQGSLRAVAPALELPSTRVPTTQPPLPPTSHPKKQTKTNDSIMRPGSQAL